MEFEIQATDQTFQFDTGKSYFKAFSLPMRTETLKIRIASFSNVAVGGFFQPDILILDSEKRIVQRVASPLIGQQIQRRGFLPSILSNEFEIPADNDRYAYIVVRTTDDLLALRIPEEGTALIPVGNSVISLKTQGALVSWPMGKLSLELIPGSARKSP